MDGAWTGNRDQTKFACEAVPCSESMGFSPQRTHGASGLASPADEESAQAHIGGYAGGD